MTNSSKPPFAGPPCVEKWQAADGATWCTLWYPWTEDGKIGPCLDFPASDVDAVAELVKAAESVTYIGSVWCTVCHLGICFNFLEHDRQVIIALLQDLKVKPAQDSSNEVEQVA